MIADRSFLVPRRKLGLIPLYTLGTVMTYSVRIRWLARRFILISYLRDHIFAPEYDRHNYFVYQE